MVHVLQLRKAKRLQCKALISDSEYQVEYFHCDTWP